MTIGFVWKKREEGRGIKRRGKGKEERRERKTKSEEENREGSKGEVGLLA